MWMGMGEDLLIGSGRGGRLAVYRNDAKSGFQALAGSRWTGW